MENELMKIDVIYLKPKNYLVAQDSSPSSQKTRKSLQLTLIIHQ